MANFTSSLYYSNPPFAENIIRPYNGLGLLYGGNYNSAFQYGFTSSSTTITVVSGSSSLTTLYRSYVTGTLVYTFDTIPPGATFITIISTY
jgi:hypothetical protein